MQSHEVIPSSFVGHAEDQQRAVAPGVDAHGDGAVEAAAALADDAAFLELHGDAPLGAADGGFDRALLRRVARVAQGEACAVTVAVVLDPDEVGGGPRAAWPACRSARA